jgi:hypothetical protein
MLSFSVSKRYLDEQRGQIMEGRETEEPRNLRAIRATPPDWLRGEARLEGEWIVLDPKRSEKYRPIGEENLVFDLASITQPGEAVVFARKYGLLWHGPGAAQHAEQFSEWEKEATFIRIILMVYAALGSAISGDEDSLNKLRAYERFWQGWFQAATTSDEELLMQASKFVAWATSEGLRGVEEGVSAAFETDHPPGSGKWGPPGVFLLNAHPPDLLGYAYHQLALTIVRGVPATRCLECGRVFVISHKRMKFCSATCSSRARQRRFGENRRKQQED